MHPLVCGVRWKVNHFRPPHGEPLPKTAHAGAGGLGCISCCVGRSWKVNYTRPPNQAPLSLKLREQDWRDSGV